MRIFCCYIWKTSLWKTRSFLLKRSGLCKRYIETSYTDKNLFHAIHLYVGFFPQHFFPALNTETCQFPYASLQSCISLLWDFSGCPRLPNMGTQKFGLITYRRAKENYKLIYLETIFSFLSFSIKQQDIQSVLWNTILLHFICTIGVHMHICTSTAKFSLEKTEHQN